MSGALSLIGKIDPRLVAGAQQALGIAAGPLAQLNLPLTAVLRMGRSIGVIIPDVTIEEHHSDRMEVTQHPVANNTTISDHAFMHPATVTMRCGWTNSNPIAGFVEGAASAAVSAFSGAGLGDILSAAGNPFNAFTETRARDVYERLLKLQASRQPFSVSTGKRYYQSMVITELTVTTDRASEYALMLECQLQEVIIVTTQTTEGAALGPGSNPQTTGATTETGVTQPKPDPDSWLKKVTGWDHVNINPFSWK